MSRNQKGQCRLISKFISLSSIDTDPFEILAAKPVVGPIATDLAIKLKIAFDSALISGSSAATPLLLNPATTLSFIDAISSIGPDYYVNSPAGVTTYFGVRTIESIQRYDKSK